MYVKESEVMRHPLGVDLLQETSKCDPLQSAESIMAVQNYHKVTLIVIVDHEDQLAIVVYVCKFSYNV